MRKNSNKSMRINSEVAKELSAIIREVKDPRVDLMTTVTDAIVTTDLKYCTVYISVLGDDSKYESTLKGLESAAGFIRYELAHRLNLRNTPELKFVADKSLAYGMHMDELISKVVVKHDEEGNKESNTEASSKEDIED